MRDTKGNAPEGSSSEASSEETSQAMKGFNMSDSTQVSASQAIAPAISAVDGKATTLSTDVARHFGKRHDNVMQAIGTLRAQLDAEHLLNFQEVSIEYKNGMGGTQTAPAYRMTRDGFTLLAMGFTGKKALAFKLAYIDAFNKMEEELGAINPQRSAHAMNLATEAGQQVTKSVYAALMAGQPLESLTSQWMLFFHRQTWGDKAMVAYCQPLEIDAICLGPDAYLDSLERPDGHSLTMDQLARMAEFSTRDLARRARVQSSKSRALAA